MVNKSNKGVQPSEGAKSPSDNPTKMFFENRIAVEWLSTKEAARYLSLTPNALRILVHRGRVVAYKLGGRLRFRLDDLRNLLQLKEA